MEFFNIMTASGKIEYCYLKHIDDEKSSWFELWGSVDWRIDRRLGWDEHYGDLVRFAHDLKCEIK